MNYAQIYLKADPTKDDFEDSEVILEEWEDCQDYDGSKKCIECNNCTLIQSGYDTQKYGIRMIRKSIKEKPIERVSNIEIVQPNFYIERMDSEAEMLQAIEAYGRTSYKSEHNITKTSKSSFVAKLIKLGHLSVLEHCSITVRLICDRGTSHELVRHRLASYTQESTRYVKYDCIEVIKPYGVEKGSNEYTVWLNTMEKCAEAYKKLLPLSPQIARAVLPTCLKTEIVVTANIREWRHILQLRTAPNNHPQIKELMTDLLKTFAISAPVLFGDIKND